MSDIELTSKHFNKIQRALKSLNDVRKEIQMQNQGCDINWFLEDSNNLNLMDGDSHSEQRGEALYENVIYCFTLNNSSGGGW
jgi:ferric iron reductase protein FhuF